ncbi:hypothetical protein VTO73DRAFT_15053 [Trametes versicolor]
MSSCERLTSAIARMVAAVRCCSPRQVDGVMCGAAFAGRAVFSGRRFLMASASDASVCVAAEWWASVPALLPLHLSCTILYELSSPVRPSPLSIYRRSLPDDPHRLLFAVRPIPLPRCPQLVTPFLLTALSSAPAVAV